jgi:O-methyltransferase
MDFTITLSVVHLVSILLVLILLFLGFKVLEMGWSYKISKPYAWDEAVRQGRISDLLKQTERSYRDKVRFYTIWLQIERLRDTKVQGAFAELGVYQGDTARFIHHMDSTRELHLFDTFEGFAPQDLAMEASDDEKYNSANFSDTSVAEVREYIGGNELVKFHPGLFPDSTKDVQEKTFAFVSLDADLYAPTKAGLAYFYSRLSVGGVIMIHDYNHTWDGCRKAVDEFVETIPEQLVSIADWQGSVLIVKSAY